MTKKIKMSKVLMRFLEPIAKRYQLSIDEDLLGLGVAVWNLVSVKGEQRLHAEQKLLSGLRQAVQDEGKLSALKLLINDLIEEKESRFSHIDHYIVGYQALPNGKKEGYQLMINSTALDD